MRGAEQQIHAAVGRQMDMFWAYAFPSRVMYGPGGRQECFVTTYNLVCSISDGRYPISDIRYRTLDVRCPVRLQGASTARGRGIPEVLTRALAPIGSPSGSAVERAGGSSFSSPSSAAQASETSRM